MLLLFAEQNDETQPLTSKEEEERRIAEMGRPVLGEYIKLEIIIEESYEFKVSPMHCSCAIYLLCCTV